MADLDWTDQKVRAKDLRDICNDVAQNLRDSGASRSEENEAARNLIADALEMVARHLSFKYPRLGE